MIQQTRSVLAVDPGRIKCGVAVVRGAGWREPRDDAGFEVLHQSVVERSAAGQTLRDLLARYSPSVILVGNGTTCDEYRHLASGLGVPVQKVDEKFSTLMARKRYFREHPPRGIRRILPSSLQTPGRPYDDYVAVILAERFLSSQP